MSHAQGDETVNRNICQLPLFWKENPDSWFRNAESNFHIFNITAPTTQYHYVVRSLDEAAMRELADILDDDDLRTNFEEFKKQVIARFALMDEKKLLKLLSNVELGDRSPSQLLRHLRSLASANVPDKMLRTLWVDKLPAAVQKCLAPHPNMALEELTKIADSVYDVVKIKRPSQVCAATSPASDPITESPPRLEVLETKPLSSRPQVQLKGQHSAPRAGPPRSWTNSELTKALQHVLNKTMTTSQASRIFGIPYNSLLMYVRGKYGKSLMLELLEKD